MQKEKIWKFDRILILIFVIFFTFRPSLKSTALFISWARLISVSAQSWKFANFKCDLWSFYVLTSWIKKLFRAIVLAIYHSVSLIAKYTLKNPSLKNVPFLEECFILFTSVCKLYMHNFTINFAKWSVFKMVISNTHKRIKCLLKKRDTETLCLAWFQCLIPCTCMWEITMKWEVLTVLRKKKMQVTGLTTFLNILVYRLFFRYFRAALFYFLGCKGFLLLVYFKPVLSHWQN